MPAGLVRAAATAINSGASRTRVTRETLALIRGGMAG
jgi:hypothetical protein